MNRKQAIMALTTICTRLAKRYGLDIVSQRDSDNGLWDSKDFTGWGITMSEYLTKKYGNMKETHFTNVPYEQYDLNKDFKVSFEYRFSNPKICIGTQWGDDGFACMELSNYGKNDKEDYRIAELMCFKESGIKYQRMLYREWKEVLKEMGEE